MSDFNAKIHLNRFEFGALPQTPLGELTALLQASQLREADECRERKKREDREMGRAVSGILYVVRKTYEKIAYVRMVVNKHASDIDLRTIPAMYNSALYGNP